MKYFAVLFATFILSLVGYLNVNAANYDWLKDDIYVSEAGDSHMHTCVFKGYNGVFGYNGVLYDVQGGGCRLDAGSVDFLYGSYLSNYGLFGVINSNDGDGLFRPLSIDDGRKLYFSDLAKALLEIDTRRADGKRILRVFDNPASNIFAESEIDGKITEYGLTDFAEHNYLLDQPVDNPSISENGRYVTATYVDGGANMFVRIDTETNDIKRFLIDRNLGMSYRSYTVSNSGRYTILGNNKVYDMMSCDTTVSGYSENCDSRSLDMFNLSSSSLPNVALVDSFRFGSENYNIFATLALGTPNLAKPLQAVEYSLVPRLDYLALGDSYSSGEGDIGKKPDGSSYYLAGTTDAGQCHLSSRSYPFLLRAKWGIGSDKMKSVACSGARVLPDYYGNSTNYIGQGRKLEDFSESDRRAKQISALDEFRPGEVQQIEFVKKYRPKVLTLTGGGNDVGFGDIIKYCASPTWQVFVMVDETCGYAVSGSELNKILYSSIDTQYQYNKALISRLKEASPSTKIIIVGYPSFISPNTAVCGLNGGVLDSDERHMINSGVEYMNSMLEYLAKDEDVSYIDVQNTLNGGRMCEGAEYVTGIVDVGLDKSRLIEAFHPNAAGHEKIANKIDVSGVYREDEVPQSTSYTPLSARLSRNMTLIEGGRLIMGISSNIKTPAQSFMPGSQASLTMYSEPVSLGSFIVASDGSINVGMDTTDLPPGRHTLVASGLDPNGVQIDYTQFIDVGFSQDDMDGDGIKDDVDLCLYIISWYDEESGNNVCEVNSTRGSTVYNSNKVSKGLSSVTVSSAASNNLDSTVAPLALPGIIATEETKKHTEQLNSSNANLPIIIVGIILLGGIICGFTYKQYKNTKR